MNFSDIYLCIKDENKYYVCKKFDSYGEADAYFNKTYMMDRHPLKNNISSTMLSVNKFTPHCLRPYVINYKLSQTFISSKLI